MPSLTELQTVMQRAILTGDDGILDCLGEGRGERRDVLFGVYRHAYGARLTEVIRNDHPHLHAYLGDDAFDAMAVAYIAANPSHHASARWFSQGLAGFLRTAAPYSEHIVVGELARIETALNDMFDTADHPALGKDDLAALAPDAWGDLVLRPHPAARRLDLGSNAFAIWSALQAACEPPTAETIAAPQPFIVWRLDLIPRIRAMSAQEAMLWDKLAATRTSFAEMCAILQSRDGADAAPRLAAQHLMAWIDAGLLAREEPGRA